MTKRLFINTIHSDPQICRQCRGLCCQSHPGVWTDPQRFYSIFNLTRPKTPEDWLTDLYMLRIEFRDLDGVFIPTPKQTESGCIFLKSQGCSLQLAQRPCQCLALEPNLQTIIDGEIHCHLPQGSSTLTAIQQWRSFWETTCSVI